MLGLAVAFKSINYSKGFWASDWIGFKNFEFLFTTNDAFLITRNTILYNTVFLIINTVIAIIIAILLKEITQKFFSRFYQSIILFPNLISMVIVSYLVLAFLNTESGLINKSILSLLNVEEISWYSSPRYWPSILTLVNTWKNVGLLSIVYYAGIIGIDQQYYESAMLDGANKFQQIRFVTLPLLTPVITTMTILAIGKIFYADFGLFYQVPLDSGALYNTTNVIDTYVFRALIRLGDIGMSSAAGFYQSIVGFLLVLVSNLILRRTNKENALF